MESKEEPNPHGHADTIHIIVNARPRQVNSTSISYSDLVKLAYPDDPNSGGHLYSVQYTGPQIPDGTLVEGQSVELRNGMKFDVIRTTKS